MENLIRRELPAHILPRICWVGHMGGSLATIQEKETPLEREDSSSIEYDILDPEDQYDMKMIQDSWKAFLASKNEKAMTMASIYATKKLLCSINDLNTIYPTELHGVITNLMR